MKRVRAVTIILGFVAVVSSILGTGSVVPLTTHIAAAGDPAQTAQSVMASLDFDATAYIIDGTITWTYDRGTHKEPGTAMDHYTNTRTAGPSFVGCTGGGRSGMNCLAGNAPSSAAIAAAEPAPNEIKLQNHAQAERCTFFFGGTLTADVYTQTATVSGANGNGNWQYEWTYTIAPDTAKDVDGDVAGVQVAQHTAWTSETTGGTVDVGFEGFIASESFQKLGARNKYSFTMIDGGLTRARDVSAQLQVSDGAGGWTDVGAAVSLNNVDTDADMENDGVAVTAATSDFSYFGNGGKFGNSAVFSALHAAGSKAANLVTNILTGTSDGSNADNFAGNNNDLTAGNVHIAPFSASIVGLSTTGTYRIKISGTIKGNGGAADFGFEVTSSLIVIGGC